MKERLKRLRTAARARAGRVGWFLLESAVGAGMGLLFAVVYLRNR